MIASFFFSFSSTTSWKTALTASKTMSSSMTFLSCWATLALRKVTINYGWKLMAMTSTLLHFILIPILAPASTSSLNSETRKCAGQFFIMEGLRIPIQYGVHVHVHVYYVVLIFPHFSGLWSNFEPYGRNLGFRRMCLTS